MVNNVRLDVTALRQLYNSCNNSRVVKMKHNQTYLDTITRNPRFFHCFEYSISLIFFFQVLDTPCLPWLAVMKLCNVITPALLRCWTSLRRNNVGLLESTGIFGVPNLSFTRPLIYTNANQFYSNKCYVGYVHGFCLYGSRQLLLHFFCF